VPEEKANAVEKLPNMFRNTEFPFPQRRNLLADRRRSSRRSAIEQPQEKFKQPSLRVTTDWLATHAIESGYSATLEDANFRTDVAAGAATKGLRKNNFT